MESKQIHAHEHEHEHEHERTVNDQGDPHLRDLPRTFWNIPQILLLSVIRLYQMTLAKTLPPNTCRFYPTCSHYGYQSIYKYGVLKGNWMAVYRVFRCNPFNPGGYDPVP